jgi:hypothetical protein
VYELQPMDIWQQRDLRRSGRVGRLVTDDAVTWQGRVGQHLGVEFQSMLTNGDGGCGLHGVWGHPNVQRKCLEMSCGQALARVYLRDALPHSSARAFSMFCVSSAIRETCRY